MGEYWTVVIPYTAHGATEWHPTEATGPFSKLSRGAFKTRTEARAWARRHLGRTKFTLRYTAPFGETSPKRRRR